MNKNNNQLKKIFKKRNKKGYPMYSNILTNSAYKQIKYLGSITNYGMSNKYTFLSGNDERYLTFATVLATELSNLATVYKYYKILSISLRVNRIFPETYSNVLGVFYCVVDVSNNGTNPTNSVVLENIACMRVNPFKLPPTVKKWTVGNFANLTNQPVFDIWFPTTTTPTYGALICANDVNNASSGNDIIFSYEVSVDIMLSDST